MSVIKLDDSNFNTFIHENQKVFVKYYADWCGSCRLIGPKYKKISDLESNQNIKFVEVNAEESPLARKFAGVTNLPFFAILNHGEIVKADNFAKPELIEDYANQLNIN